MAGGAISYGEVLVRLLIAVALCGLIGFEREARDQAAGLRTHIILGVGAALFTLVSAYGFEEFRPAPGRAGAEGAAAFDPTRIAAQIVSGVGFLGAGAILRHGRDVRGSRPPRPCGWWRRSGWPSAPATSSAPPSAPRWSSSPFSS